MHRNIKSATILGALSWFVWGATAQAQSPDEVYMIETKVVTVQHNVAGLGDAAPSDTGALMELLANWPGYSVLAAPSIVVRAGQEAEINIGQDLQYLERREDGAYEVRTLTGEEPAGVHLEVRAEPEGADKVRLKFDLSIAVMSGRAPVPGLKLDVGVPMLSVTSVDSESVVEPGEWVKIAGQEFTDTSSGQPERLIVVARVTVPPTDGGA